MISYARAHLEMPSHHSGFSPKQRVAYGVRKEITNENTTPVRPEEIHQVLASFSFFFFFVTWKGFGVACISVRYVSSKLLHFQMVPCFFFLFFG